MIKGVVRAVEAVLNSSSGNVPVNIYSLIKQSGKKVLVEFKPAYNEEEHGRFPERLKKTLRVAKKVVLDGDDIYELPDYLKVRKDIKKFKLI